MYPQEAYVIEGTYCPDRASAIEYASAAASCAVGMGRSMSLTIAGRILEAANASPLQEVWHPVTGPSFSVGRNPNGCLKGHVRAMRVRWAVVATVPAPSQLTADEVKRRIRPARRVVA
jgi:hypothetical protein